MLELAKTQCTGLSGNITDNSTALGRCLLGGQPKNSEALPGFNLTSLYGWEATFGANGNTFTVLPDGTLIIILTFSNALDIMQSNGRAYWNLPFGKDSGGGADTNGKPVPGADGPPWMDSCLRSTDRGTTFELINTDATLGCVGTTALDFGCLTRTCCPAHNFGPLPAADTGAIKLRRNTTASRSAATPMAKARCRPLPGRLTGQSSRRASSTGGSHPLGRTTRARLCVLSACARRERLTPHTHTRVVASSQHSPARHPAGCSLSRRFYCIHSLAHFHAYFHAWFSRIYSD